MIPKTMDCACKIHKSLDLVSGDIKNLTKGAKVYFPVFVEGESFLFDRAST